MPALNRYTDQATEEVFEDENFQSQMVALRGQPIPFLADRPGHYEPNSTIDELVTELSVILRQREIEKVWRSKAACTGLPTAQFFPEKGGSKRLERAGGVCGQCAVKEECGTSAATLGVEDGFWGGELRQPDWVKNKTN